ncbi:GFA family protein [Aspergillus melleus]|uniref:GFA family protein n=1 Tax=Aspergillus melleus TaxID=138277 RepID=UPI001E8DCAFD|nr:uncharacterized protein LDX57_012854 [Aspergillus melleus]KAH8435225.1 hypothetical protein LDX57_012854 [Aspergillus melleus]
MVSGSCFCGQVRVECNGLLTSALCHCTGCRKLTGTLYTYSFVVKTADLTVIGTPKEVAKTADSGNHIKNYFCSNCGMYCRSPFLGYDQSLQRRQMVDHYSRNSTIRAQGEGYGRTRGHHHPAGGNPG